MARVRLPKTKKRPRFVSIYSERISGSSQDNTNPTSSKRRKITTEEEGHEEVSDFLVPTDLYHYIKKAMVLRDHLKTNNNDVNAMLDLASAEGIIPSYAEELKNFNELPRNWKYDPSAAKSYKPSSILTRYLEVEIPEDEEDDSTQSRDCCRCCAPFKIDRECYAKTNDVPLTRTEKKIWKDFREFDKDIPGLGGINLMDSEKEKIPIKIDNPIVSLIGNFAIAAFNEAIEKSVKKGVHKNLRDFEFMECAYIKMTEYYFYLAIEAVEEGKLGVYKTKVKLKPKDGRKSLGAFVLTDYTPLGKKKRVMNKRSMRRQMTFPGDWLDPTEDKYTGMKPRDESATCMGYDYHTAWGFEGP